ncbi:MAG: hypothetical protein QXR09_00805 [Candidatus Aenigmatarchaeota archaeon]
MKKIKPFLTSIFILLLVFNVALAAEEVSLSLSTKILTAYTGGSTITEIIVKNNQAFTDTFSLSIFPPYQYGILVSLEKYSLTLHPGENKSLKIYFEIPECAETTSTSFSITVRSTKNKDVYDSENLILETIRKYGICIYEAKLNKQIFDRLGEHLQVEVLLKNPSETISQPFVLQTNILLDKESVARFDENIAAIEGKGVRTITHELEIDRYKRPGTYTIEILLKDNYGSVVSQKKLNFKVLAINATEKLNYLPIRKSVKYGFFVQTIEINVSNEGNVPTGSFYVSESIPIFMKPFFFPKIEPTLEETKENRIIYSWQVPSLSPGDVYTIKYEISTWNAVLIAIILIIIIVYSFAKIFSISIEKKHKFSGPLTKEKEITIMLEIKNRTRNEIKDVIIRDFVPGIATVVEKFDTLRPSLRKIANGTELVWKIPSLAPGDERILTYRIKPIIDIVGTLKLPKAYVKFMNKKKEVKKILSKSAYIKAG